MNEQPTFGKHHFEPRNGQYYCTLCQYTWPTRRRSPCPGVKRYDRIPAHLKTSHQLLQMHLQPGDGPDGCYYRRLSPHVLWLFDATKAERIQTPLQTKITTALHQFASGTEHCQWCGADIQLQQWSGPDGETLCYACSIERRWQQGCRQLQQWASDVLQSDCCACLDTETTGMDEQSEVIELAMIDMQGRPLLKTWVRPPHWVGTERVFRGPAVPREAPHLADLWPQVTTLLTRYTTIIAYNADFHRRLLRQSASRYGLMLPDHEQQPWLCLMQAYALWYGQGRSAFTNQEGTSIYEFFRYQSLRHACEHQQIPCGRSERALQHAKRLLSVIKAIAEQTIHWQA